LKDADSRNPQLQTTDLGIGDSSVTKDSQRDMPLFGISHLRIVLRTTNRVSDPLKSQFLDNSLRDLPRL
jgi:hypothetical protein